MILRHATHRRNLESIRREGLGISYATGDRMVVWMHAAARTGWAAWHVAEKHGWDVADVVVLTAVVDPAAVRKHGPKGIYYCLTDVLPACVLEANEVALYACLGEEIK